MIFASKHFPGLLVAAAVTLAIFSACKKSDPPAPVVHVAPVFTRPFEDGYAAGFEKGHAAGKPRAKLPSDEEAQAKATEAAAEDPELHTDKWQRGWAEGYVAGFRDVTTHQK